MPGLTDADLEDLSRRRTRQLKLLEPKWQMAELIREQTARQAWLLQRGLHVNLGYLVGAAIVLGNNNNSHSYPVCGNGIPQIKHIVLVSPESNYQNVDRELILRRGRFLPLNRTSLAEGNYLPCIASTIVFPAPRKLIDELFGSLVIDAMHDNNLYRMLNYWLEHDVRLGPVPDDL